MLGTGSRWVFPSCRFNVPGTPRLLAALNRASLCERQGQPIFLCQKLSGEPAGAFPGRRQQQHPRLLLPPEAQAAPGRNVSIPHLLFNRAS